MYNTPTFKEPDAFLQHKFVVARKDQPRWLYWNENTKGWGDLLHATLYVDGHVPSIAYEELELIPLEEALCFEHDSSQGGVQNSILEWISSMNHFGTSKKLMVQWSKFFDKELMYRRLRTAPSVRCPPQP